MPNYCPHCGKQLPASFKGKSTPGKAQKRNQIKSFVGKKASTGTILLLLVIFSAAILLVAYGIFNSMLEHKVITVGIQLLLSLA